MLNRAKLLFSTTLVSTFMASFVSASKQNIVLADRLFNMGVIRSKEVLEVMKSVDRGFYAAHDAYSDFPQPIGYQATISAPHMHGFALEYLKDHLMKGTKSLDIGSGSGYLTVCFAKMMNQPGAVAYGIEHIPELVEASKRNIEKYINRMSFINIARSDDKDLLNSGKVVIVEGDGRLGLKEHAPFDAIHVGAAATEVPRALLDQLANGGRMLIPVGGPGAQDYLVIDKDHKGTVTQKKILDVRYVPLTDREKQWPVDL